MKDELVSYGSSLESQVSTYNWGWLDLHGPPSLRHAQASVYHRGLSCQAGQHLLFQYLK